ncbi:lantibiotic immunity ABC transporter MutE/EpiE family permease subunit [Fusibacter paucivorans]|uniref:Lantibiotic immunity ABC transporter MutE/EpiE family permease subunit n=1 Tax=Fusibacter paucivorans TaxID=76009 RepID=A0ABS5PNV7_9FIRM|nr:lantibiotic immunity ABC transporter MutE/EpiE family permease subunit [Fusibacter paucivorans]MBS7526850.1 lantibiotic immunity ABC transporter MutE/EpiE family permease subunit [Fusibacter paucivorans]
MNFVYLNAENIKFKHTVFRKLIWIIPASLTLLSMIFLFVGIGIGGFSSALISNWSMPMASLSVVILCDQAHQKEQKHQYHTLYTLPIDLKRTFTAKTILIAVNLWIISMLLASLTAVSEYALFGASAVIDHGIYYFLGYGIIWLSLLWQIPVCLFLVQKAGLVMTVIIHLFASAFGGIFISLTPLFWIFPYSWPARLMITLFGVLPNGLLVSGDSRLSLPFTQSVILALSALMLAIILTIVLAVWYGRQVYRK